MIFLAGGWGVARALPSRRAAPRAVRCASYCAALYRTTGADVDLDPLDVVSFPPGLIRRFENVTPGDPDQVHILMFVIGGNAPRAEFTDKSMSELESRRRVAAQSGVRPPSAVAARAQ